MAQEQQEESASFLSTNQTIVTRKDDEVLLEGDCYLNFINSLKSEATSRCYKNALIRFLKFSQVSGTEDLAKLSPAQIEF